MSRRGTQLHSARPRPDWLMQAWRESMPREEWNTLDADALRHACASLFRFAGLRRRRQTLLRLVPAPQETAAPADYSVLELVTDDMPFLVDTLGLTLAEAGIAIRLIVHPVLSVRRDARGRLSHLQPAYEPPSPASSPASSPRESWQYLRIERIADAVECRRLEQSLRAALSDVRRICSDWPRMRRAVRALSEDIARAPPPLPPAVITESRLLLQYLAANHFTFFGYREQRLRRGSGGTLRLEPVPRSGLGILRRSGPGPATPAANIRRALRSPELLLITKAGLRSTVHRAGYLDYVGVKRFDARGRVIGEARILGLWTTTTYRADPQEIPWLRLKLGAVRAHFPFAANSHDAKRVTRILQTLPREELLQADVPALIRCVRAVLTLQDRAGVRLILRRDDYRRFWSCLVYLPRERCDSAAQVRIGELLRAALRGAPPERSVTIGDAPLAQLHVVVRVDPASAPRIDATRLERAIADTLISWRDRLREALQTRCGRLPGARLERRYAAVFPAAYCADTSAAIAAEDILDLERLEAAPEGMPLRFYRLLGQRRERAQLRILRRAEPLALSELLPTLEHFGLRVIAERPYRLQSNPAADAQFAPVWVQDLELEHPTPLPIERIAAELIRALRAVRAGLIDDDGFNRLLIGAELDIEAAGVLRACCRYLLQTGIPFSQAYMERVLAAHAGTARLLAALFQARLAPARPAGTAGARTLELRIRRAIDAVTGADEDRILRAFLAVILATVRTNHFRRDDGKPRSCLALKLESARIPGLPRPLPAYEIFVHSPRVEGVHLRKGRIARGGIRWSERPEDFRTEILGLMKTQHVKNTLIVPVGAKGGFVARRLSALAPREQQQREVVTCYQSFIRALLDVTDNIVGGRVQPPPGVRRLDRDDPYLVVAADKGTAAFSDLANAIAAEYGYWLGDAFASGGSTGYDHKGLGITARGAWICVERHFRELGRDIGRESITAAGIGDMSGDVFGNGMLLSRRLRLLAAFDHRHIFVDPDPDPARGHRERLRLFRLPRSSWNDYDRSLLSRGGGVFERAAKRIPLSPEARSILELPPGAVDGVQVVRAILGMRVDLLWNGGIGTYVKATPERHADIGDRANDAVRVNGADVRALVVGEGGNLGFSPRGRVEYAARGGRINADFIDNSAGVNTSDLEVNLKILLDAHLPAPLPRARRNRLLRAASPEVAALVLRNNYLQSQAISLLERRALRDLSEHEQLLRWLEQHAELDRAVEALPGEQELQERRRQGRGLTRPELALLLAYGKIALDHALAQARGVADPYLGRELERYFPAVLRRRFAVRIAHHRLRAQIVDTATTNSIVNRMGPSLLMLCTGQSGADAVSVARAYTIARDSADLRALWTQIETLDGSVATEAQYDALLESSDYLRHLTLWLLGPGKRYAQVGTAVARLQPLWRALAAATPPALAGLDRDRFLRHRDALHTRGFPRPLADRLASLDALRCMPDLAELMQHGRGTAHGVAQVHFALGADLGFDWLRAAVEQLPTADAWQLAARERLQGKARAAHLRLSARALAATTRSGTRRRAPAAAVSLDRWRRTLHEARAAAKPELAVLTTVIAELEQLTAGIEPEEARLL